MWTDALIDAGRSFSRAGVASGENGKVQRSERYEDYDKPISLQDIEVLRSIGRKSINEFTSEEIEKAQKWAYKFYQELRVKSPFFRAWFGDWRAYDRTPIEYTTVDTVDIDADLIRAERGTFINADTKWSIVSGSLGEGETKRYSRGDKTSVKMLSSLQRILESAVLIDTVASVRDSAKKHINTAFMHKLFAPVIYNGEKYVAKINVEEYFDQGSEKRRIYHLEGIKIEPIAKRFAEKSASLNRANIDSINSISDLFAFVKEFDKNFSPKEVNEHLIDKVTGEPKVFYHCTKSDFTVFDRKKAKSSGLYGKGFYFTDSKSHSAAYGDAMAVYLNIRKPLSPDSDTVTKAQIRNFLSAVAENEDYSIENYGTYDVDEVLSGITSRDAFAVIQDINATAIGDFAEAVELFNSVNGTKYDGIVVPTETVAFYPEQIKSETDNIGTFDSNNPDIQYSDREDNVTEREILADTLMGAAANDIEKNKLKAYKAKVKEMEAEQEKLGKIKAQIKELSFAKGKRDTEKIKRLRELAVKTENRINIYDRQLLLKCSYSIKYFKKPLDYFSV